MEENLIKKTCKELGLTYRELGEAIGLSEAHIKRLATSDNADIVEQVKKSIGMLFKIRDLEVKMQDIEDFTALLKKLTK